jgi:transcriptional regulator with XRE-family HTH domain
MSIIGNIPHSGEDVKQKSSPQWGATNSAVASIIPVMGNGLKFLREKAGLTHLQAGEAMGISRGAFIKLERGERKLSADYIARAVNVFDASEREILGTKAVSVSVVGYAAAGADSVTFADGQGPFDEVEAPSWANETTVAVRVRGTSLGLYFDGWLAFYDNRRDPPDDSLVGALCVCGLSRGRVVIKKLRAGSAKGLFHLESETEPTLFDERVEWAAEVKEMRPR